MLFSCNSYSAKLILYLDRKLEKTIQVWLTCFLDCYCCSVTVCPPYVNETHSTGTPCRPWDPSGHPDVSGGVLLYKSDHYWTLFIVFFSPKSVFNMISSFYMERWPVSTPGCAGGWTSSAGLDTLFLMESSDFFFWGQCELNHGTRIQR